MKQVYNIYGIRAEPGGGLKKKMQKKIKKSW